MPFGLSSTSEVMQKRNDEAFCDINGVHVIADDIVIAATTEKEHDSIFRQVLDWARQMGVKCNLNKMQYKVNSVQYMGNLVASNGQKPDNKKIEAIINMPTPILMFLLCSVFSA